MLQVDFTGIGMCMELYTSALYMYVCVCVRVIAVLFLLDKQKGELIHINFGCSF